MESAELDRQEAKFQRYSSPCVLSCCAAHIDGSAISLSLSPDDDCGHLRRDLYMAPNLSIEFSVKLTHSLHFPALI